MTKAVCFFVQHFHKSDRTNIGYGSYLQYWYDHAKSFGFDTMLYIDDTDDKNVPTIQNDSQDFTRLRFENLGDVLEKYPDLKIIPMVEPVEFPDWEENIWELSKKKLPKDNFMLVFGRDTGGIKVPRSLRPSG